MKKTKKAFSLIEVITASIILSIAVFGVFKLIGENQKLINNSDNYRTATSLFVPVKECIENIGSGNILNKTTYINLNNCNTSTTSSGIILDNIEYILYSSGITDKKYILKIETGEINLEKTYSF